MNRKRDARAKVERVEEILRRWDPIDVRPGENAPASEYDRYAPHIASLVIHGCSQEELSAHLKSLRVGLGFAASRQEDEEIAREIIEAIRKEAV